MVQLTDKHWAVEVPDNTTNVEVCNYGLNDTLEWIHYVDGVAAYCVDDLPTGTYRFLFTTKAATEEDARKVVRSSEWHFPEKHVRYVDYKHPFDRENKQRWGEGFGTALDSLASLLRSKGLNPENNFAIIEKEITNDANY